MFKIGGQNDRRRRYRTTKAASAGFIAAGFQHTQIQIWQQFFGHNFLTFAQTYEFLLGMSEGIGININDKSPLSQFLILVGLILLCYGLLGLLMGGIALATGLDMEAVSDMKAEEMGSREVLFFKIVQCLSVLVFIAPAIIFVKLKHAGSRYLQLNKGITPVAALLAVLVTLAAMPVGGFLYEINRALVLPDVLSGLETWMLERETQAEQLTIALLDMDNIGQLLFNIFMVGVLAALGEEILFRGVLQRFFMDVFNNPHTAIALAAALFSFFHFQFYGFLPRFFIGIFLGYLFYWSGNLWYPIIGHFVHNALQVVLAYQGVISPEMEQAESIPLVYALMGVALLTVFGLGFQRLFSSRNNSGGEPT